MPTSRTRHVVTESDAVAQMLDDAARRWPDDTDHRATLLLRLVEEGHRALLEEHEDKVAARRRAVSATSGALTGRYEANYLATLRADWPE